LNSSRREKILNIDISIHHYKERQILSTFTTSLCICSKFNYFCQLKVNYLFIWHIMCH